jgi:ribosome assembly protein RRB1
MSKRTVTQTQTSTDVGQSFRKASRSGAKRETTQDEIGEFEDAWEDEIEEEEQTFPDHNDAEEDDPNGISFCAAFCMSEIKV